MLIVIFQGKSWILTGDLEKGGAITTVEAYRDGTASYAHLGSDGVIRRFYQVIGRVNDIVVIGPADEQGCTAETLKNLLFHPSWTRNDA